MSYQKQFDQIIKCYKKGVCKLTCSAIEVDINEPYAIEDESGAVGTGFFVDKKYLYIKNNTDYSSYIVTNAHVVECCPSKRIKVSFPYLGEVTLFSEIIIICREIDFAVLKVNSEMNMHLPRVLGKSFAELMETIPLCVPDQDILDTTKHVSLSVLGIGYPLDSDDSQISLGSVSGKCEHMLQMNQSISSGNSGGPLFTPDGKLVGITAASFEDSEGISLCIPWSHIDRMLKHYAKENQLILHPPSIGITTEKLVEAYQLTKMKDSSIKGGLVKKIFTGSCLYRKGISAGDIITSIGDANKEYTIDASGLVQSPYQSDKIHFTSLNILLDLDVDSMFIRTYTKKGKIKTINFQLTYPSGMLQNIMPVLEKQDCLILGGVVFTDLTKNHIEDLEETALDPTIVSFLTSTSMSENAVVISGFKQPTTLVEQGYGVAKMSIVNSVQGKKLKTVTKLREILTNLIQEHFDDLENVKKRFIEIKTPLKTYMFDLKKAFELEPYLLMSPGFPEEKSIISTCVQNDHKRPKKRRRSSRINNT
tara:strand:- start:29761 stop:31365 length:1605 start_codon:yes stop_codon:yes gene_type:complete